MSIGQPSALPPSRRRGAWEVFLAFSRLGLTAFGGPIAHLGYFRREFVERRAWLDEAAYADLVALAQFLPGPASSQVGFALGLRRAGALGGLAAFVGFTAPSALLMVLFAYVAAPLLALPGGAGLIHGLQLAAVAVVAQAVVGMARSLSRGVTYGLITAGAALLCLALDGFAGQAAALLLGAAVGLARPGARPAPPAPTPRSLHRRGAVACLALFAVLLGLSLAPSASDGAVAMAQSFYRSGALVFGGGHVVAPLLEQAIVAPGWVSQDAFLQGYGAAQALPGPLFAFAAFLGAATAGGPAALLAIVAIFAPGLLLMAGALPFWGALAANPRARAALAGVNAAVVGVLAAALYDPIVTGAIRGPADAVVAVVAFVLLMAFRAPPLAAVALCALGGVGLSLL